MESAFFTVADWVANPRSNSIRRKNRRSVLPPRLMDLLFYFAQHPMEVVSRQEIIDNCWDRDVVTDQAIMQANFLISSSGGTISGTMIGRIPARYAERIPL